MPYFEVGKSRRYADRRVGLSIAFLFMALCWFPTGWVRQSFVWKVHRN